MWQWTRADAAGWTGSMVHRGLVTQRRGTSNLDRPCYIRRCWRDGGSGSSGKTHMTAAPWPAAADILHYIVLGRKTANGRHRKVKKLTANRLERSATSGEAPKRWFVYGGGWRERKGCG